MLAGKPELPLHQEAIERTEAKRPLVVGDRLDTDIEGAVRAATDSLLVLTGVTPPGLLLAAAPQQRPTYLAADLRGLLTPHPPVTRTEDGAWRCGTWSARVRDRRLEVTGAGDPYDGLRAACAACWAAPTDEPPPEETAPALRQLGW
jgi:glycerol 3-phosphatase-2